MNSITLFKGFLRRGPLGNEVGDPRLRPRFLLSLGEAVEEVGGDEATGGDIKTALFSGNHKLAIWNSGIGGLLRVFVSSSDRLAGSSLRQSLHSRARHGHEKNRNDGGPGCAAPAASRQHSFWRRTWLLGDN